MSAYPTSLLSRMVVFPCPVFDCDIEVLGVMETQLVRSGKRQRERVAVAVKLIVIIILSIYKCSN